MTRETDHKTSPGTAVDLNVDATEAVTTKIFLSPAEMVAEELKKVEPSLVGMLAGNDAASALASELPKRYAPANVAKEGVAQRAWELASIYFLHAGRVHEALVLLRGLYLHMLTAQTSGARVHKGVPLVWMSDCYWNLNCRVHAKRFLMLTLCEDSLSEDGEISPDKTGVYHRLVWRHGLSDSELRRYARQFFELAKQFPEEAGFPEALLQRLDTIWQTEIPSPQEASTYIVNAPYVEHLLSRLGSGEGQSLELLAQYIMSCIPGCRTNRRMRSSSTDYDLVCSIEGSDIDFRSEFGRYFVCECKDWDRRVGFASMAKFCRVLDSTKAKFGILFAKQGVSGSRGTKYAVREQLKVFQDRGIVIVVIDQDDLNKVSSGENLVALLRDKYESVRLDLAPMGRPTVARSQRKHKKLE